MEIAANAPRNTIKIQGRQFQVPAPFDEGHVLNKNEAGALNQVLAENLRNNFASKVKEAEEAAEKNGGTVNEQELQSALDTYVKGYEFGVRRAGGGGGGLPKDPVEREAVKMAREAVRTALKQKNLKADAEKINTLADQYLERNPDIRKEAKRRVEASKKIALDELDLGETEEDEGSDEQLEDQEEAE